jgi:hypothetical protein
MDFERLLEEEQRERERLARDAYEMSGLEISGPVNQKQYEEEF